MVFYLFIIDVLVLFILLTGVIWSVARRERRIWPPPSKSSWQYRLTWILFYMAFGLNTALIFLDWNTWVFTGFARILIAIPLITIGISLLVWGIRHLGVANTSGISSGFIKTGPYRFTRNPQYLGDILLFIGLSILTNSLYLWITHSLLILVFVITPIPEEDWLVEQYGESYVTYLEGTSRFM